jgi:hypothetical protein
MSYMTDNSKTPAKDGVGSSLSIRLDSRTDSELDTLTEILSERNGPTNASQVVRMAIHRLYVSECTLEGND